MKERIYREKCLTILLVDDNRTSLNLLECILDRTEYGTVSVESGNEALAYLKDNPGTIDMLLLDRFMPGLNGLDVCRAMKSDEQLKNIPVIMQTAASEPDEVVEGIKAGVFYYLTKPLNQEMLLSVIESAVRHIGQYRRLRQEKMEAQGSYRLIESLTCSFRTPQEIGDLTSFLAHLFPDPDRCLMGISELLINAVEHGNLEISYDLKTKLNTAKQIDAEIERRLQDPVLGRRKGRINFCQDEKCYILQITDEGNGFCWQDYLDADAGRVLHNHGRGIAMARMLSFDRLEYNEKGNSVSCIVEKDQADS